MINDDYKSVLACRCLFSAILFALSGHPRFRSHGSSSFTDISRLRSNTTLVLIGNGVIGNIPNMAHSRNSKMEEELKCPVCLDFFKSPVRMTPCGHNYCQECLAGIGLGCPRD